MNDSSTWTLSTLNDARSSVELVDRTMASPPTKEDPKAENDSDEESDTSVQDATNIEGVDRDELRRIATAMSHRRSNAFNEVEHSFTLPDPQQGNFDEKKFIRSFMHEFLEQGHAPKKIGISYTNLKVSGDGAALRLQDTVGTMFSMPLRLGEHFSLSKKNPTMILNGFDGLLQPGELLIVLGRPGSGCSTLLKTMCGELHGLHVDDGSTVHYDGIPQKQMVKEFKGEIAYNQEVCPHSWFLTFTALTLTGSTGR